MVRPIYPIPLPDGGLLDAAGRRLTPKEQRDYLAWLKRRNREVVAREPVIILDIPNVKPYTGFTLRSRS